MFSTIIIHCEQTRQLIFAERRDIENLFRDKIGQHAMKGAMRCLNCKSEYMWIGWAVTRARTGLSSGAEVKLGRYTDA